MGPVYYHDQNADKGARAARFRPNLPRAGRYLVCLAYTASPNRASNVPVTIRHRDGETTVHVNQRVRDTVFPFVPLGEYHFNAGKESYVYLRNAGTDGFVVYDAVRWVWLGPE